MHAGDQAHREPTLGPLRHSADVRLRLGDPAPSGPPLGPLRLPVERNGGPGKGRNLRQNRGGGRTKDDGAVTVQRKSPGTPCGAGHVGLTHTETQRGRLWTA